MFITGTIHGSFIATSATSIYLPIGDFNESTSIGSGQSAFIAPYNGNVNMVKLQLATGTLSASVSFHLNDNSTPVYTTPVQAIATSGVYTFTFAPSGSFVANDRVSVRVNPTNNPGTIRFTIVNVYNT